LHHDYVRLAVTFACFKHWNDHCCHRCSLHLQDPIFTMNPCERSAHTRALEVQSPLKSSDTPLHKMTAQAMQSPPRLSSSAVGTSTPSSSKVVSPTSIARPRARSLATWVPLLPSNEQDLLPTRKLSLGRYFNTTNDEDNEDFLLVPPQQVNAQLSTMTRQVSLLEGLTLDDEPLACERIPTSIDTTTTSRTFRLEKRANPLANPFSLIGNEHVSLSRRPDVGSHMSRRGNVESTPPPRLTLLSPPPPCRHQDTTTSPLDCLNVPDKLLLPFV
jgi:hypothetical protein